MACLRYSPDYQAQGDCRNCGHTYNSHLRRQDHETAVIARKLRQAHVPVVHVVSDRGTMGRQVRENDPAPLIIHRQAQPGEE